MCCPKVSRMIVLAVALTGASPVQAGPNKPVPMKVRGVMAHRGNTAVVLQTPDGKTLLPIWIGRREAEAIQLRLSGKKPPRPLTHDLMESMLAILGARVERVEVDALRDGVFIGKLNLRDMHGKLYRLDGRPSDLITLSLRARVPVHVAQRVLKRAGVKAGKPAGGEGGAGGGKKPTTL